jgi:hypothetical protein
MRAPAPASAPTPTATAAAAAPTSKRAIRAAREAAEKDRFLEWMRSVSSSSSGDTTSNADETRRGAPVPTVVTAIEAISGLADISDAAAATACMHQWGAFRVAHASSWREPPPPAQLEPPLRENRDVHPSVATLLSALTPKGLRLWHDDLAEDDEAAAKIRPDFCVSSTRDSAASTLGAVLIVEVKLPGELDAAARQARIYLRRRIYKLCRERDARREAMDSVVALGAATDGCSVCILRMSSGAPPPGGSFAVAKPCPVLQSEPLTLLGAWDFRSAPPPFSVLEEPPAGVVALERHLRAAAAITASESLETLDVNWGGPGAAGARLTLAARLGSGGSSDTYRVERDSTSSAEFGGSAAFAAGRGALVLKTPRFVTAHVRDSFDAEGKSLELLATAASRGLVPTLIARGSRAPDWPVLLLQPCGQPLAEWVARRVAASAAAAGPMTRSSAAASAAVARERLACALSVVPRVLDALEAAHFAGVVHCDVRPSNVVVVGDEAVLVDWGSSCAPGTNVRRVGVAAYADERVFLQGSYLSRPAQDAAGALFTFLAIAFGPDCGAPWFTNGARSDDEVFAERSRWLQGRAASEAGVSRVLEALTALRLDRGGGSGACETARAALQA